ncbi:MAG: flagellar hook-associated protein FlgK [Acidobacteriota bacterium]|nr:flagellar hook-associated protein FlgK [Acidobacteriota bacterium]
MGGLSGTLGIAVNALMADQGALEVSSNNIANANTPAYTRERPDLVEQEPVQMGHLLYGQGVSLQDIQSVRDPVLELRIQQGNSRQGQLNASLGGMNQVQSLFSETQGVGLENVLSQFFSSLQSLSANPSSIPLRQGVLSAAQNLTDAFHQASSNLDQVQTGLDGTATQDVSQVNQLSTQIAAISGQIDSLASMGGDTGSLVDQRTNLVNQLSSLIGLTVTNNVSGNYTLSTENGSLLVVGNQSFALQTKLNAASGMQDVYSNGSDITQTITEGELGGLIQTRDVAIPGVRNSLDTLAYNLAQSFNTQHAAGFDLSGAAGGNFFTPLAAVAGSASNISVAITDPSKIAASANGTPGSNGNAQLLAGIENQPIVGGETATDYYANLVDSVGNQVSYANSQQQSEGALLQQLHNQLASVSGVSIDEEAANLVLYQQAYQASAQVVSMVNHLIQTTINMAS